MRTVPILLAFSLLAAACTDPPEARPTTPSDDVSGAILPAAPGGEPIEVIRVLDGDSLEARVGGAVEEIRMLGINTPERYECWSDEAREATSDLIEAGQVAVVTAGRDRFGRLLGYVSAGDVFVNAALVAAGHAMTISNDHAYMDEFRDLEDDAFDGYAGLWGPTACGPDLGFDLRIDEVDGNPSGEDDDPRSGESVLIANHGDVAADLEDWVLRDESSLHRYRVPAGATLGPGDDLRVFSICGVAEHCFGDEDTVWSNGGDTAFLLDPSGNVVDRVRFGS
ncbi:MAG: lamin tail domain-containing protein [Acidimicrobiia bacterium]|nr:lamin tail domain-containing protein [Acidimicrobiia bacterium]